MQIKDFILPNKRTVVCAKPETVIDCYRALRAVILCALKSECLFTGLETQLLLIKSSLIGLYKTIYNVLIIMTLFIQSTTAAICGHLNLILNRG